MAHQLPDLPYAHNALEPHVDAKTMEIHHGKHHAGYVAKLNAALEGQDALAAKSVVDLLKKTIELTNGYPPAVLKLADIYYKMGDFDQATIYYQKSLDLKDFVQTTDISYLNEQDYAILK